MREPIEYDSAEQYEQVMAELARLEREFNEAYTETTSKGTQPQSHEHYMPMNMNMKGTSTMKMSDAFKSRYLRAEDVEDEPVLTIIDMRVEDVSVKGAKKEDKCVLYFKECEQGMVVNKTNWKTISDVLGSDDSDDWIGKRIQLYMGTASFQGEEVDAIRVKRRQAQRRPAPPSAAPVSAQTGKSPVMRAQAPPEYYNEPDEEIPF